MTAMSTSPSESESEFEPAPASMPVPDPIATELPRVCGILGTSRSGSTWVGAMVASHPDVAYRFEPFHRRAKVPAMITMKAALETGAPDPARDASALYEVLATSDPSTDRPPFFKKNYRCRIGFGRHLVWPMARKVRALHGLFDWCYGPTDEPRIVFKDVNLERMITGFRALHVPLVYLMRHPCGVVWSHLRGQELGVMRADRETHLQEKLRAVPALEARFGDALDELTKVQKRALLWRLSTEQALASADGDPSVLFITYESLCQDPLAGAERIFAQFRLGMSDQTVAFLTRSGKPSLWSRIRGGELGVNTYFSVFRDSSKVADAWKTDMPAEAAREVLDLVQDCPAYRLGVDHGW